MILRSMRRFLGLDSAARRTGRSRGHVRPTVETLEAREVPTYISFPTFKDTDGLTLNGSAALDRSNNSVNLAGPQTDVAGSMFAQTKMTPGKSWTSSFVFEIDGQGGGIVFVVQNDLRMDKALGDVGGALGVGTLGDPRDPPSITPSVAVEFDTFFNFNFNHVNEPNDNHVGVDTDGSVQTTNPVVAMPGFKLYDQKVKATITFNADTKLLKIFAAPLESKLQLLKSTKVLMGQTVGPQGYVGFSSATGAEGTQNHYLLSWKFSQGAAPPITPPGPGTSDQRLAHGQLLATALEAPEASDKSSSTVSKEQGGAVTRNEAPAGLTSAASKSAPSGFTTPLTRKPAAGKPLDMGSAFTPEMLNGGIDQN